MVERKDFFLLSSAVSISLRVRKSTEKSIMLVAAVGSVILGVCSGITYPCKEVALSKLLKKKCLLIINFCKMYTSKESD